MNRRSTRNGAGVLAKFRELPGARLAVAAFLVTVVLGLGGPPAYAWWSQRGDAEITATAGAAKPVVPSPVPTPTAPPALVKPGNLQCERDPKQKPNNGSMETKVSWAANGAPGSSSYIMDFTVLDSNGSTVLGSKSYVLPLSTTKVKLADLPELNDWFEGVGKNNDKFTVAVRNVWFVPVATVIQEIPASVAAEYPVTASTQPFEMQYKVNKEGYHC